MTTSPDPAEVRFDRSTLALVRRLLANSLDVQPANALPADARPSAELAVAGCDDLDRSMALLSTFRRRYDDLANARERAHVLEVNLSRVLNLCLRPVASDPEVANVLDQAKDLASSYSPSDQDVEAAVTAARQLVRQDLVVVFLVNLAYELVLLSDSILNYRQGRLGPDTVCRVIQFPPEYYEAGMTILSGFASLVRERYRDEGVTVKITQDGLKVSLVVESPGGREEIERTLADYGSVLRGERDPQEFPGKEWERLRLEQTLAIAKIQIETQNRIIALLEARDGRLESGVRLMATSLERLVGTVEAAFSTGRDPVGRGESRQLGPARPPQRVFLSYSSEMARHPGRPRSFVAAAERAVRNASHVAVHMDGFTAQDQWPADLCAETVAGCDIYLALVGFRYGSIVPSEPSMSYTELEFVAATRCGLPRLVFILDEHAEGLPVGAMFDPPLAERQQGFRARLAGDTGVTLAYFRTPDELQDLVYRALTSPTFRKIDEAVERSVGTLDRKPSTT